MKLKDEKSLAACKSGESGAVSANYNNEQFNVTCQDLFCNETMRNIFLNFTNRVYEILCAINNTTRGIKDCIQRGNDTTYNATMWACKAALGVDPNANGVYSSVGGCNPAGKCGYLDLYGINATKN